MNDGLLVGRHRPHRDGHLLPDGRLGPRRRRAGRPRDGHPSGRLPRRSRLGPDGLAGHAQPSDVAHPALLGRGPAEQAGPRADRRGRRGGRRVVRRGQPRGLVRPEVGGGLPSRRLCGYRALARSGSQRLRRARPTNAGCELAWSPTT